MFFRTSVIFYFLTNWFWNGNYSEQKCHIVGDSKTEIIQILKSQSPEKDYNQYIYQMLSCFEGVPYGNGGRGCPTAHTLVNVNSMDCMTFIENIWAISFSKHIISQMKTIPPDSACFSIFVQNLNAFRYYEGRNQKLEDRIQYLSSAFKQLEDKGLLVNVAKTSGVPLKKNINYITTHKSKYRGFTDWKRIRDKEIEMSNYNYWWYPLDSLDRYAQVARNGDLVGLVTSVPGLDVSHCGIISVVKGELFMTHASSIKKKVTINQNLNEYLSSRTTITGLIVYRPVFPDRLSFLN